jgi:hypothetical protein
VNARNEQKERAITKETDHKWTRKLMKADLEDQAEWRRRKAIEYPDDRRNVDAAEEYQRLAKTLQDIRDDLLFAYSEAFEDGPNSER